MSSPSPFATSRLPLPDGQEIEVCLVRLEDGRIVARTREELDLVESAEKRRERSEGK